MKAILSLAACVLVGSPAFAQEESKERPKEQPKEAKFDAAKLVGTWTYTSGVNGGEKSAEEALMGEVKITAETFTLPGGPDITFVMAYKIDASASPATIDIEIKSGPEGSEGSKAAGIIKLDGDTLTICYNPEPMGDRPAKFESTKENGAHLFTLKRKSE